ncbi:unnamed protein product [Cladocopium goreaui]|uniref:Uncharacterized protein n=1 Tax=Cladocopium goreaui TaxID=2562237 RepID=A0A9P1D2Q4_9DINO|nr:unnamed protein product [Cladocopium goreaui]
MLEASRGLPPLVWQSFLRCASGCQLRAGSAEPGLSPGCLSEKLVSVGCFLLQALLGEKDLVRGGGLLSPIW